MTASERLRAASRLRGARLVWRPATPLASSIVAPAAPLSAPLVKQEMLALKPVSHFSEQRPALAFPTGLGQSFKPAAKQQQVDLFKPKKTIKPKSASSKPQKPKVDRAVRVLKALELPSLQHMLLCVPSDFSDCRYPIEALMGLNDGFRGLFWLKRTGVVEPLDERSRLVNSHPYASIFEAPYRGYWSRVRQIRVELVDENGHHVWLSVFGAWRLKDQDPLAAMLLEGELQTFGDRRYITGSSEPPADVAGKIWVRYVCPGAPSEADVRGMVQAALADPLSIETAVHSLVTTSLLSEGQLLDIAENSCGQRYDSLGDFIRTLHEPESPEAGELAASAARAMAVAGICSAAHAANTRHPHPKTALNIPGAVIGQLIASQPETLTVDQVTVVQGLASALRNPKPLNGLISGDVGTGKTLTFLIPAVAAFMAGAQVAIVSPTEILANQVAANLSRRFPQVRVERVLAGGKIKDPQAILIGTSGLGSVARKCGYTPSFLIVDEQHKLATKDRNAMVGAWTHQLEASATPIPRSLAATLFSGTQVFNLNQAPVERNIESFVLDESERSQAVGWMKEALDSQQRVAVIYPRVTKSAEAPADESVNGPEDGTSEAPAQVAASAPAVNSVNAAAEALERRFPGRVGKLHGKLASYEVEQTLQDFRDGVKHLVVASTIFETGIDVPDIRMLMVKDADNFGIAQLHQLRGRLARNGGHARFVMMVSAKASLAPETAQRLETVRSTTDGYALAEADMMTRGFGDLAGNAQSGNISCAFRLLRLGLDDFQLDVNN